MREAVLSPTRRSVIGGMALAALPLRVHGKTAAATVDLLAGGYNREGGRGLLPLRYDPLAERWQTGAPIAAAPDASFAAPGGVHDMLYAVEEGTAGMVSAFRRAGGGWSRVAHLPTQGADPCHLAYDKARSVLAIANYSSGSVALYALDPRTGVPGGAPVLLTHRGHGPNAERQAGPHAHMVLFTPDDRWLLAVDLGADTIFAYPFTPGSPRVGTAQIAYKAEPGSGPRHLAPHPHLPRAYLVNELANTVTVLRAEPAMRYAAVATVSTLPPGFTGANTAAEILVDRAGTRLYVSNRGHDSVAVYAIDGTGALTLMEHVPSGGQGPRHLLLLEQAGRLLVSNEKSGRVNSFRIAGDGRLTAASSVAAPGVTYTGVVA